MRNNVGGAKHQQNLIVAMEEGSNSSQEDDINERGEGEIEDDQSGKIFYKAKVMKGSFLPAMVLL